MYVGGVFFLFFLLFFFFLIITASPMPVCLWPFFKANKEEWGFCKAKAQPLCLLDIIFEIEREKIVLLLSLQKYIVECCNFFLFQGCAKKSSCKKYVKVR